MTSLFFLSFFFLDHYTHITSKNILHFGIYTKNLKWHERSRSNGPGVNGLRYELDLARTVPEPYYIFKYNNIWTNINYFTTKT